VYRLIEGGLMQTVSDVGAKPEREPAREPAMTA
jgi:hypothetical protein